MPRANSRATPGRWCSPRKLTGGEGDVALAAGKQYNFGFAIHDDSATGRFHHVSLGYTLGLDDAKAEVNVVKQ